MVIPFRYVAEAAREEVKVGTEKPGSPRSVYAKQLAAYALRRHTDATLAQIAEAVGYVGYRGAMKAVASVEMAIEEGDTGIRLQGQWFAGSLKDAAQRVWTKATIRAATERHAA